MEVNLFGNINGSSYNIPTIDLLELARKKNEQLINVSESKLG